VKTFSLFGANDWQTMAFMGHLLRQAAATFGIETFPLSMGSGRLNNQKPSGSGLSQMVALASIPWSATRFKLHEYGRKQVVYRSNYRSIRGKPGWQANSQSPGVEKEQT
jgi:hypothetical protein